MSLNVSNALCKKLDIKEFQKYLKLKSVEDVSIPNFVESLKNNKDRNRYNRNIKGSSKKVVQNSRVLLNKQSNYDTISTGSDAVEEFDFLLNSMKNSLNNQENDDNPNDRTDFAVFDRDGMFVTIIETLF